jgi:hypothetical protein
MALYARRRKLQLRFPGKSIKYAPDVVRVRHPHSRQSLDGKLGAPTREVIVFQMLIGAGDN